MAPTQSERPFLVTQVVVMAVFVVLTILATKGSAMRRATRLDRVNAIPQAWVIYM